MQNKVNNRSFGLLFFGVFFIIGVWPVTYAGEIRLWSLILSIIFLISGLLDLKFLSPFKKTWIKFGEIIGKIISPIVLASIFFLIITPISLILRIFGKDLLKLKKNKITKTYWILRKNIKSMKRQF